MVTGYPRVMKSLICLEKAAVLWCGLQGGVKLGKLLH